ncbi:cobyrinic acid a,c-diamide synthase [Candidatus Endoriftia persephone str. Guaymas]|jgi:cellulose biosynthesis protein BcsQ|uniref:Chromosome (Plasmid) partitioning protein ParA n=4 Tax=Gammaproteobacteria TaxID=1236 RepID=G2FC31_9GAMM|nr:AAA family ATPase [Candidatus Endoriftia persephone]MBA1331812.1 cobyrinic acid a,c-diamide synthase [Candidatus Endoriftia persephone str. Guaymas]EGV50107.1 cobyrinic acid ac-diamide synthase [endosymbiont of Riftia pachyptila (vent Ph05)]EGW55605.1 chromosome (plasmid) partitioning protein ParA [endosymbiont of Tevnia jerichonana (vent Tica)]KRT54621.1 Cellulose biosynthesis protein BcsQ [endosymbiont of Ridgeia piscesae]KRT57772.1 Cellulose biosynthesis protein BcsQ [endosymbiont of Rid
MKIIGVYNIKGGVGKTATAVNLAYLCARAGYRTLIWDLDPQAAATFYFRIKPKVKGGGKGLLNGRVELDRVVKGTDFENLDLLPADFSYRNMDLKLEEAKKPTKQLLRLLRPLSEEYDYIFLDCPPSISLVSENIFRAADGLLLPLIPTTLSLRTFKQLLDFLEGHRIAGFELMPFFSMVDRRKRMHLDVMQSLPDAHGELLKSVIPYASDVERMGIYRMPVAEFAHRSPAAKAYEVLWQEVGQRLR